MSTIEGEEPVIVVSGLPRSGTSLMMQMCEAGGLIPLTDNVRKADKDNPRGYYELEEVKTLGKDNSWVPRARGRVIKVISALLKHLPQESRYKLVFMLRDIDEVIASQKQMLARIGEQNRFSDEKLEAMFRNHLRQVRGWLSESMAFETLYVDYNQLLRNPYERSRDIGVFLGDGLDHVKMAEAVDQRLYRQKNHIAGSQVSSS
jgi:hypothetical protein